jgi:hypothetical protein
MKEDNGFMLVTGAIEVQQEGEVQAPSFNSDSTPSRRRFLQHQYMKERSPRATVCVL